MKVKMLKTGEVQELSFFRAVLLVEQGMAVPVKPKPISAKISKKETANKAGEA